MKHRLRNYKSHIKEKVRSCSIVNHFIDVCSDPSRMLQKERFWISTLVTMRKGLNSTYDWNRKRRTERPKENRTYDN